jgi:hypothetical protein
LRGSSINPSFSVSFASQAATAALVTIDSLAAVRMGEPSALWVAVQECANPNVWRMRLFAGAPAMMPS